MDILQRNAGLKHQHHHMVGKVCDFVNGFLFVLSLGGDDDLGALLANLFQNLIQTLFKEVGGVRAFLFLFLSAPEQLHQAFQGEFVEFLTLPNRLCKAGLGTCVAGRAIRFYLHNQCIVIAVRFDGHDMLIVAAGLPLQPQLLTGTAPEAGQALLHRDLQAFLVHICQGQHLLGNGIYHNGRNQAVFVKFQFFDFHNFLLIIWQGCLPAPFVVLNRGSPPRQSGKWRPPGLHLPWEGC